MNIQNEIENIKLNQAIQNEIENIKINQDSLFAWKKHFINMTNFNNNGIMVTIDHINIEILILSIIITILLYIITRHEFEINKLKKNIL